MPHVGRVEFVLAGVIVRRQQESGRDQRIENFRRESFRTLSVVKFVAGKLLSQKPLDGLVVIE